MKTTIITGITGQDGAYLSKLLLEKGYKVVGTTRSYNYANLKNLSYLGIKDKVILEECDLLDLSSIIKTIDKYEPDEIYNLAAQSSVSLSFEQPIETVRFNSISVLDLMESIKIVNKNIKFYQASTSEMFGKAKNLPVSENTAMHPLSPYAISKASGHWTAVNYRESHGLFACCGMLFNHESYFRSNNFFVKKVITESLNIRFGKQEILKVGNIDIKRDFGYAPKYVAAMWLIMQQEKADDFIVCSGKSVFLREIIYYVFDRLKIDRDRLVIDPSLYRPAEIEDIYGDNSKAKRILGWEYNMTFFDVLDILLEEEKQNYEIPKI